MSQIKKNLIYNVAYQILILILPIITVPYVSRVLGADGIGTYSYTYSIIYYFMLVAMLGINNYGNRTIAKNRDDKEKLSNNFFSIYAIQIFMTILMIIIYMAYINIFSNKYYNIAFIQIIQLFSCIFDINWFFFGLEKFKITVTRSTVLKLLSLILIFIFVRNADDIWIYTLILSSSTLISQLLLIPFLYKEVQFTKVTFKNVSKHIKPCLVLFLPVIAVSLYRVMDKIMLGKITGVTEVGYYEQAEKIINIPMGIVTALGIVMLPRISNLVYKGDNESILRYMEKSINFMMFLAFPICFGLMTISSDFIPIFLGDNFIKSSTLIYYLSTTILFMSFANVIRTQYLIPKEKDSIYVISLFAGAIINLIINYLLIPKYQSVGACIGTIFAEFFVMLYQVIAVRKELPILKYIKDIRGFFIKSIVMFVITLSVKLLNLSPIVTIITQVLIGVLTYGLLNIKYVYDIINPAFNKHKKAQE